jgi:hypothetical protein
MFIKSLIETKLDAEIESALEELKSHDKMSKEYGQLVDRIAELHKLKTEERSKQISPDTVLVVAANLFGILWLARYERENVIKAPKAFGSVMKLPR